MEEQVLTVEQINDLITLGVDTSSASCYWYEDEYYKTLLTKIDKDNYAPEIEEEDANVKRTDALTLFDILELIPGDFKIGNHEHCYFSLSKEGEGYIASYNAVAYEGDYAVKEFFDFNPVLAAYAMLKYVKESENGKE